MPTTPSHPRTLSVSYWTTPPRHPAWKTQNQDTPFYEPLPQALKGPHAQPVLRLGASMAGASPLNVPCWVASPQLVLAKEGRNHEKATSPPPTARSHCKLASPLPACAPLEAVSSCPLLPGASLDPSVTSRLLTHLPALFLSTPPHRPDCWADPQCSHPGFLHKLSSASFTPACESPPTYWGTTQSPSLENCVRERVSWLSATPWTVAGQAPLSMEFARQEHWSG